MKKIKISALFLTVLTAVVIMTAVPALANTPITLIIDGNRQSPDVAPIVVDGTTLVPLRLISETLGADVEWNATRRQATIRTAAYTVVFTIGSTTYTINGANRTLLQTPQIINDRTLVPIRAFAEAIGAEVGYNATTHTATVDYFTKMTGSIIVTGSTTVQPIAQAAADKLMGMNTGLSITVSGGGSGAGVNAARDGTAHIGMSSRELTATELGVLNAYPVANDGVAIIVHRNNPVNNLTMEQARGIFAGEITNWNQVGGNNAAILVQTRETGSGTLDTLNGLLMSGRAVASTASPHNSNPLLRTAVAGNANAIGFVSVGYVDNTIKALTIGGRTASDSTIMAKTYPLSRFIYVCTRDRATGVSAVFIDYLRSLDCQENIVKANGFVKLN